MARSPDYPVRFPGLDVVLDPGDVPEGTGATWGREFEKDLPYRFYSPAFAPIYQQGPPTTGQNYPNIASLGGGIRQPPGGAGYALPPMWAGQGDMAQRLDPAAIEQGKGSVVPMFDMPTRFYEGGYNYGAPQVVAENISGGGGGDTLAGGTKSSSGYALAEQLPADMRGARRNNAPPPALTDAIAYAVGRTYGPGYSFQVRSGIVDEPKGTSGASSSGRHIMDGPGASDVRIFDPNGNQLAGASLTPLAQNWVSNFGSIGINATASETNAHGWTHMDLVNKPGRGQGYVWSYGGFAPGQKAAVLDYVGEKSWVDGQPADEVATALYEAADATRASSVRQAPPRSGLLARVFSGGNNAAASQPTSSALASLTAPSGGTEVTSPPSPIESFAPSIENAGLGSPAQAAISEMVQGPAASTPGRSIPLQLPPQWNPAAGFPPPPPRRPGPGGALGVDLGVQPAGMPVPPQRPYNGPMPAPRPGTFNWMGGGAPAAGMVPTPGTSPLRPAIGGPNDRRPQPPMPPGRYPGFDFNQGPLAPAAGAVPAPPMRSAGAAPVANMPSTVAPPSAPPWSLTGGRGDVPGQMPAAPFKTPYGGRPPTAGASPGAMPGAPPANVSPPLPASPPPIDRTFALDAWGDRYQGMADKARGDAFFAPPQSMVTGRPETPGSMPSAAPTSFASTNPSPMLPPMPAPVANTFAGQPGAYGSVGSPGAAGTVSGDLSWDRFTNPTPMTYDQPAPLTAPSIQAGGGAFNPALTPGAQPALTPPATSSPWVDPTGMYVQNRFSPAALGIGPTQATKGTFALGPGQSFGLDPTAAYAEEPPDPTQIAIAPPSVTSRDPQAVQAQAQPRTTTGRYAEARPGFSTGPGTGFGQRIMQSFIPGGSFLGPNAVFGLGNAGRFTPSGAGGTSFFNQQPNGTMGTTNWRQGSVTGNPAMSGTMWNRSGGNGSVGYVTDPFTGSMIYSGSPNSF